MTRYALGHSLIAIAVLILSMGGIAVVPSSAQVNPPTAWELQQNQPNPFCPDEHGTSEFVMIAPRAAHLELDLWRPDSMAVLRTLVVTDIPAAGVLTVWWDGRDLDGVMVPEGRYPYVFRATDETAAPLFEARNQPSCSVRPVWSQVAGRASRDSTDELHNKPLQPTAAARDGR
jgi:hypothetical protein